MRPLLHCDRVCTMTNPTDSRLSVHYGCPQTIRPFLDRVRPRPPQNADKLGIVALSREVKALALKARDNKLKPEVGRARGGGGRTPREETQSLEAQCRRGGGREAAGRGGEGPGGRDAERARQEGYCGLCWAGPRGIFVTPCTDVTPRPSCADARQHRSSWAARSPCPTWACSG